MTEKVDLEPGRLGVSPVGLVFTVEMNVATRHRFVPPSAPGKRGRLLIQVGPVLWAVLDRTDYSRTRELWEEVAARLG